MTAWLDGRDVLEIACGTGYWTQFLSERARSICAVDLSREMPAIAKSKKYGCPIDFMIQDAYNLSLRPGSFDGAVANFWFSHVPKERVDIFMRSFHGLLKPGARVFMADNVFIPGLGGELYSIVGDENSYKIRKLRDGSEHLVLKNYYSAEQLTEYFKQYIPSFNRENIFYGDCFWFIFYQLD